jgi:hypothetical protein
MSEVVVPNNPYELTKEGQFLKVYNHNNHNHHLALYQNRLIIPVFH